MKSITSPQNPRFKAALLLARNRGRKRSSRFLIHGAREISRGLDAGIEIEECFCCPAACDERDHQLQLRLAENGIPVWAVSSEMLQRLRYGDANSGLVVVARAVAQRLPDLRLSACPLIVVCDHLEKPGNLGAIVRSADAVGADAVLLADPLVDCYHPNVIRASTGCVFTLPLVQASGEAIRDWLASHQIQVGAAHPQGTRLYSELDFRRPCALVFGNEARGLSPIWRDGNLIEFRLPMQGVADSLNVSVTAAVVLFEVQRQRASNLV